MPVRLVDNPVAETVELFTGGTLDILMMSMPADTLVVPEFCKLVTAATERLGSTAIAVGGPLNAMVVTPGALCTCPEPLLGLVGSKVVTSTAESVLDPLLATRAKPRS